MLIKLKAKYQVTPKRLLRRQFDPVDGTWVFSGGRFKSKTANQGGNKRAKSTTRPRKRAYGPF